MILSVATTNQNSEGDNSMKVRVDYYNGKTEYFDVEYPDTFDYDEDNRLFRVYEHGSVDYVIIPREKVMSIRSIVEECDDLDDFSPEEYDSMADKFYHMEIENLLDELAGNQSEDRHSVRKERLKLAKELKEMSDRLVEYR